MTYRLNPAIAKISSPVRLVFPEGKPVEYDDGLKAAAFVFENRYVISDVRAEEGAVVLVLKTNDATPTNWVGETQTFF